MMLPFPRLKVLLTIALSTIMLMAPVPQSYAQDAKKSSSSKAPSQSTPTPSEPERASEPAPYDAQLARLAEILGALQYIEGICKISTANDWRSDMSKLLTAEAGDDRQRQMRFTAAYNRGYRSFAAVYTQCTANAKEADTAYRHEGATLAQEITSRFGN